MSKSDEIRALREGRFGGNAAALPKIITSVKAEVQRSADHVGCPHCAAKEARIAELEAELERRRSVKRDQMRRYRGKKFPYNPHD